MVEYYVLETASLEPFLPFLPPAQQQEAKRGKLRVVGAAEEDTAVGAAAFDLVGETAHLVYMAVSPDCQKRGVAAGMLWYFASVMVLLDCRVLSVSLTPGHPAEEAVERIMEKLGARLEVGADQVVCPISALRNSPLLKPLLGRQSSRVVPLEQVAAVDLRELDAHMLQNGATSVHMDWKHFDPKLSFIGMDEHYQLNCCVCAVREEDGISVEWIYTTRSGAKTLIVAVLELLQVCQEEFSPDARFSAVLVDDKARKLLERLAGIAVDSRAALRWVVEV